MTCKVYISDFDWLNRESNLPTEINSLINEAGNNEMMIHTHITKPMLITTYLWQKLLIPAKTILQLCAGTSQTENGSEHETLGLTIDERLT